MYSSPEINLAILASGAGSNADKICSYFKDHADIHVRLIISNNINAGVLKVASSHGVESMVIPKSSWATTEFILPELRTKEITHIVLAGFLLLLPSWLVKEYHGRIINIHPALLPKHGGKGMYGHHVHEKVKSSGDLISGITIHKVDEHYDEGDIIFQKEVNLDPDDSASLIAVKVLQLEHHYYSRVIEKWVSENETYS
ncbi:MAG TPA: formyltransferase family protein [Saprospiraceae bacterium]|nr:formyltransferase family protein [Saprospiraceae bacterium]